MLSYWLSKFYDIIYLINRKQKGRSYLRKLSLLEFQVVYAVLGFLFFLISFLMFLSGYLSLSALAVPLVTSITIVVVFSMIVPTYIGFFGAKKTKVKNIPGYYNPITKYVEFHIGNKNINQFTFAKQMLKIRNFAQTLNRDIIFTTNLLSLDEMDRMERIFNAKIEVHPVRIIGKITFFLSYGTTLVWIKDFKRQDLRKFIVRIEKKEPHI